MSLDRIRKEWRSICGLALMFIIAAVSLGVDIVFPNDKFWFQRSGALITLAGVWLQYSKLVSTWKQAFDSEMKGETQADRLEAGKGSWMSDSLKENRATRQFVIRLHEIVTAKSTKDKLSVFLMVCGTLVWAYGDLLFR
ncbi:TPA: hypothetical protein ACSP71_000518 [Aeromonas hydrophila]